MADSHGPHRVALISSSYHPHFGGVEEHVRHVAAELASRGHEVEVWTVDRGERLGVQQVDGIAVRYLPTPLPARRVSNLARFGATAPGALVRWLGAARQFRPDVLHVHCFGPNGPYAMAVSALTRTPLVVTSHGETFADQNDIFGRSALLRRALQRACISAAAVTGVSSLVADDLRAKFSASSVTIVPNGVTPSQWRQPEGDLRPTRERDVVAVGRMVRVKGFDLLLEAVAKSTQTRMLRLVGDGPEAEALKEFAAQLGISDRVEFMGRRSSTELRDIMARAGVVAIPSRKEAFGIVALEAWASGTPLVATSLGGPAGFLTDGVDGVLVDPEDTEALAGAIDSILSSPEQARSLAEHGLVSVQEFTWSRVAAQYEEIYNGLSVHA